jgi:UDP-glucose 4-epimerase
VDSLVTGGAGFIGSNLVDALVARGDSVVVIDDLSTGRRENLAAALDAGARLVEADIRDGDAMRAIAEDERPAVIFHLAAQMNVRLSVAEPVRDLQTNAGGTVNMLEAARAAGVGRFVNVSTGGAMYGQTDVRPTPESQPGAADAPYGVSKHAAEEYAAVYAGLYGLSTVSLRLGNVFGPRQHPLGEAGVVAIFCGVALAGGRPTIYGDGRQTRDFVYVGDVVEALLLAAGSEVGGAVNVGSGAETSMLELADAIGPHAAGDFAPVHEPERLGEILNSCLDSSRAREELGWSASTSVVDGIALTLDWMRAFDRPA